MVTLIREWCAKDRHRCEKPVPGSVVRTGSARSKGTNHKATESAALPALRTVPEAVPNVPTAAMDVEVAVDRLSRVRQDRAHIARAERELRRSGEAREEHAGQLGCPVAELVNVSSELEQLDQLAAQARRLSEKLGLRGYDATRSRVVSRSPVSRAPDGFRTHFGHPGGDAREPRPRASLPHTASRVQGFGRANASRGFRAAQ
ncbi:hypothetical protein [Streptomyces sp. NPDC101776]|uniref:hypothetical protein n=1 Tax=Streptomyces sp. NPDC101776 TaxID=3366146 RepID=UPI0038089466